MKKTEQAIIKIPVSTVNRVDTSATTGETLTFDEELFPPTKTPFANFGTTAVELWVETLANGIL